MSRRKQTKPLRLNEDEEPLSGRNTLHFFSVYTFLLTYNHPITRLPCLCPERAIDCPGVAMYADIMLAV